MTVPEHVVRGLLILLAVLLVNVAACYCKGEPLRRPPTHDRARLGSDQRRINACDTLGSLRDHLTVADRARQ